MSIYKSMY